MEYFSYKVYAKDELKCTAFDDTESLATTLAAMLDKFGEELKLVIRRATDKEVEENGPNMGENERKEPNMYPTITLETYPPMFTADGYENPFYDEELTEFTVPYRWLSELYQEEPSGDFDLDFFLTNEYTWDDTYSIYERAKADKVIVKERIVSR